MWENINLFILWYKKLIYFDFEDSQINILVNISNILLNFSDKKFQIKDYNLIISEYLLNNKNNQVLNFLFNLKMQYNVKIQENN